MNIQSVDFISFYYFQTLLHDGTEYRFCYSTHALDTLGFAVWHEHSESRSLVEHNPKFVMTFEAARDLAKQRNDDFRKSFPPCTYHEVAVERAEFAKSVMKEDHKTLRRWVSAQGLAEADFAITLHRTWYRLSFRSMNSQVEAAILFLRVADVLRPYRGGAVTIERGGRMEDQRWYKAGMPRTQGRSIRNAISAGQR
jgi:hypothetical protein